MILCNFHSSGRDGVDKDETNKCIIELIRGCYSALEQRVPLLSQPNAFDVSSEHKA